MFSFQKFIEMAVQGETVVIDMLHAPENAILESSELWKEIQNKRSMFYTKDMKAYLGYVRKQASKYGVRGSRLHVMEKVLDIARNSDFYIVTGTLQDLFNLLPNGEHSQFILTDHPSMGKQCFYEICGRKYQSTLKIPMFIDQLQRVYDSYGERARLAKENKGIDWKAVSHSIRAGYQLYHIYKDDDFTYPLEETDFIMEVKKGNLDFTTEVQPELENIVEEVSILADKSDYPTKVNRGMVDKFIMEIHEEILNEI